MTKKLYELTDEHRAQLRPHADWWIANNLSTKQMDDEDRAAMRVAMAGMYAAANLEPVPEHRQVFAAGPVTGAIAASIASGVWWLRENPGECVKLFGRVLSEDELMVSCIEACVLSVRAAMGLPVPEPAVYSAVYTAVDSAVDSAVAVFLVRCTGHWHCFASAGCESSAWAAFLTFFDHAAKLDLPIFDRLHHYESAMTHGGYRFTNKRFWVVSDRPTTIGRDTENRPHCDDGPQLAWRDGFKTHYWHGIKVTRQIIEAPETLTVAQIQSETNAEVRRVMLTRFGESRYIQEIGAMPVHEDEFGALYRVPVQDDESVEMVRVLNSTPEPDGSTKTYWLRCEPGSKTAQEAVASTWRYPDGTRVFPRATDYTPMMET